MNYQCEVLIHHPSLEEVSQAFVNSDLYHLWQPGIQSYTHVTNTIHQVGAIGILRYSTQDAIHEMREEIKEISLPHHIKYEYTVPGVINRCDNKFSKTEDGVLWKMDITFIFDNKPQLDIEVFKEQTLKSMNQFKHFMETYKP